MGKIKPLPEAVRNSVRSGIIVCDLTRVVEELVFNSLDAGATKVTSIIEQSYGKFSIYLQLGLEEDWGLLFQIGMNYFGFFFS